MDRPGMISILVAGACFACADGSRPDTTLVADSAGVRVVTNLPGSIEAASAWSLAPEPAVEIGGGANPEHPLHRITAVQPLEGGRVAVGTSTPPQALIFHDNGTLAARLGRPGNGPGEFADVASVVPVGTDSLAVWDPGRRRLSVFTRVGAFAREVDLSDVVPHSPRAAASTLVPAAFTSVFPTATGTFVVLSIGAWGPGAPEAGAYRLEYPSVHMDTDGTLLASYGPFPGLELYKSPIGEIPLPFGANLQGAVSDNSFVVGTGGTPELRFYAPDGDLEQVIRWPEGVRTLATSRFLAEFQAWLDTQFAQREPREQALFREVFTAIPMPEVLPAYAGMIGGDTGEVWVGEYPGQLGLMGLTPEDPRVPARRWLVFNTGGTLLAIVTTPEGFQPFSLRDGRVWGVYQDELDVQSVRAYALNK